MEIDPSKPLPFPAEGTLVVVMDTWDQHWDKAAEQRLSHMIPALNRFLHFVREQGCQIMFTPYESPIIPTKANHKVWDKKAKKQPGKNHRYADGNPAQIPRKPKPYYMPVNMPTSLHPGIEMDKERDYCVNNVEQVTGIYGSYKRIIFTGVHLNYCLIDRCVGFECAKTMGAEVFLVPELTDILYFHEFHGGTYEETMRNMVEWVDGQFCQTIRWVDHEV